jgi:hypothetical protein
MGKQLRSASITQMKAQGTRIMHHAGGFTFHVVSPLLALKFAIKGEHKEPSS